ncbi:SigB/SigF/SigG family RNA polymerase sigma factor [Jiangella sp. DSM 45060]|uniref:SigB/SigF/SigG family RNA polymerase sigma factor n=1 Tax=Jiangella sp. DSM 45060 TaxID=1798224 RepID=UPI00087D9EE7|nr:SigB/SigF/SigG family RNA polymerase sigma factor [Jiangella sp. DSM 45060]SDT45491.1 RNA polymerase sigma-B factor [Jiangella sp. DSM 45060]
MRQALATHGIRHQNQNHDDHERLTMELLERSVGARGGERLRLLDEVVVLNLGLAESIARRYYWRGIERDDLLQVANLGLVNAVRRFDPGRGKDFVSFAVPTISGEVKRYFRDHGWTVRPPRRVQELAAAVTAARTELSQDQGRAPTASELAGHLGVGVEDVREAEASRECFTAASIDYRMSDDDTPLAEALGEDDDGFARADAVTVLGPACRELKPRDRRILYLRFFKGLTQQEIGEELGVTQMQVSRLLARILGQLRASIAPAVAPR